MKLWLILLLALTACHSPTPFRILFVGNSHTLGNDVPGLVQRVAAAKGQALETETLAVGGYTLRRHFEGGEVRRRLEQARFDAVVLQEQSGTQVADVNAYRNAAARLAAVARERGVQVYVFMGWPRADLEEAYGYSQSDWTRSALDVARAIDAGVAPVGEAWSWTKRKTSSLVLQQSDGNHATLAGSYVAACTLFYSITGVSPLGAEEKLTDIALSRSDQILLEGAALDAVLSLEDGFRRPLTRKR